MRISSRPFATVLVVTALVLSACSSESEPSATTTSEPDTTTTVAPAGPSIPEPTVPAPTLDAVAVNTAEVADMAEPVALAPRPGTDDLYVVEQEGTVRRLAARVTTNRDGTTDRISYRADSSPALDLSDEVAYGGEQGLLGLAFSSDGRSLYVDFTDGSGATKLVEYAMSGDRADSRSRRDLLTIPQPFANHNGGQLQLGPDGFLYVGMGDGGGAGDPEGNGQNPATLLGTILRIDPQASTPDRGYAIPAGNPYILGGGAPEVWITGARNPWRFSFDRLTGDLWVADVGQDELEELNLLPADASGMNAGRGANLGWPAMEGDQPFSSGEPPPGAVAPILTYGRDSGACSVIGGYVYRGTAIPALQGAYLYGDFCTGEVRALLAIGGIVVDDRPLGITVPDLASFGQTSGGELMTMSKGGEIRLITPA